MTGVQTCALPIFFLKPTTLTNDILFWNSGTSAYTPYSGRTAGKFDNGILDPTHTNRLNYDGNFYTNISYASNSFSAPTFNTTNSYVQINDNSTQTLILAQSSTGISIKGISERGNALSLLRNTNTTFSVTSSMFLMSDTCNYGTQNVNYTFIDITSNPTTSGYISGSTLKATIGSTIRIDMNPRTIDSGTSVAYMFDTNTGLTATGAKLMSIKNFGTEKVFIDKDGYVISTNAAFIAGTSDILSGTDFGSYTKSSLTLRIGGFNRMELNANRNDASNAIAYKFDIAQAFVTTGAKLVSVLNNGTEKFYIDLSGNTYANGTLLAGAVAFTLGSNTRLGGGTSWGSNSQTTVVGYNAGNALGAGSDNTFIGNQAGRSVTTSSYNTLLGSDVGYSLTGGTGSNVMIGYRAGYTNVSGASNIFIGNNAGYNELGSNKLYISNTNTTTPLIGGDFLANTVTINGTITANNVRKITLITLTSGVTTTWDMNSSCSAQLTLNGATTLNVSGVTSGDNGTLIVVQNGVGAFTFPSGSKYTGGTPHTLSGAGQKDILSFYYDGSNYYWNIGKNYA